MPYGQPTKLQMLGQVFSARVDPIPDQRHLEIQASPSAPQERDV
jgi:hypothetical protein